MANKKDVQTVFMLFNKHYLATRRADGYVTVEVKDGLLWKSSRNPRVLESAKAALEVAFPETVDEPSWRRPL